jgi:hypothetical protein
MTVYNVYGRTKATRMTRLGRITDRGELLLFSSVVGPTWTINREQLTALLRKYDQLGYRVVVSHSQQERAA